MVKTKRILVFLFIPMLYIHAAGSIRGKVTDENGRAMHGVAIWLENTSMATYTYADGSYFLTNVPSGTYTILVKSGKYTHKGVVEVVYGNVNYDVRLGSNSGRLMSSTGKEVLITVAIDNIRAGPSSKNRILGKCRKGERYTYLDTQGKWYIIEYNGKAAYTYHSNGNIVSSNATASGYNSAGSGRAYSMSKPNIILHAKVEKPPVDAYCSDMTWLGIVALAMLYGDTLMDEGKVVLGRDIMVGAPLLYLARHQWRKYNQSFGTVDQLEAQLEYRDASGKKVSELFAGETGDVVLKIQNKSDKPVKGIQPQLATRLRDYRQENITLSNVRIGGKKTLFNNYELGPNESMVIRGTVTIPSDFSRSEIQIVGGVTPMRKANGSLVITNPNPPDLVLTDLKFNDQDGDEMLAALESGELLVTVRNNGDGPARNIRIFPTISDLNVTSLQQEQTISHLEKGQSRQVKFSLKAEKTIQDGVVNVRINGAEGRGFDARAIQANIRTARLIPSNITVDNWTINDGRAGMADGNNNRMIENSETVEVKLEVRNSGSGPVHGARLIPSLSGGVLPLKNEVIIGQIAPNSYRDVTVAINVPVSYNQNVISLGINIKDSRGTVDYNRSVVLESYYRQPELVFDYVIFDGNSPGSRGNQNGMVEQGETIELEILPQNLGEFTAEDVTFQVTVDYPGIIKTTGFRSEYLAVGRIPPKNSGDAVKFPFTVQRSAMPGSFKVNVEMEQANFPGLSKTLSLDLLEETVETVAFGQERSSGFGRFGAGAASGFINVDVPPYSKNENSDAVAVVIGNRSYRTPGVPSVDYAERDARIFKAYLTRTLGFREPDVMTYNDATFADFTQIFGTKEDHRGRLYSRVKKGDKVIVYYSGHGAPDVNEGTGYFVPSDSDPSNLKLTGYSVDQLTANLAKLPTKDITVVIDACFSGQSHTGKFLIEGISPAILKLKNPEVIKGVSLFSASEKNQVSSWYPEVRHGVFTYYFLAGMRGYADNNKDKKITYKELADYLAENVPDKVREISSGQRLQTPTFVGDENKVMVELE